MQLEKNLKKEYGRVKTGTRVLYGGSQMESERKGFRKAACGVISAADLFLYLGRQNPDWRGREWPEGYDGVEPLAVEEHLKYAEYLERHYFPVIPGLGILGPALAAGMNLYFLKNHIPFRARWGVRPSRLFERMDEMLDEDLPVIMSVGPNFPFRFGKHTCKLYVKDPDGTYSAATGVAAHFMNATGLDDAWMKVSSWGKEYYINRDEYMDYMKKHSNALYTNMIVMRHK